MRLVAALVVVVHHAKGYLLSDSVMVPAGEAVSFFFVLSGFILTYAYHQREYTLSSYYLARVASILPASLLSIFAFLLLINPYAEKLSGTDIAIAGSNIFLIQSLIPIPAFYFGLNAVLWSVSVEIFFYVLFPLFERYLHRSYGLLLLVSIPLATGLLMIAISKAYNYPNYSPSVFFSTTWHGLIYINPLSRLKEFVLGMLTGVFYLNYRHHPWTGGKRHLFSGVELLAITALVWGLPILNSYGYLLASKATTSAEISGLFISQILTSLMFSATIFIFAVGRGWPLQLLRNKIFVIGGEISFSVYLFHQIFIIWQHKNPWLLSWCQQLYRFPVTLVFTIAFSFCIWRWFECPMRTLILRTFRRP